MRFKIIDTTLYLLAICVFALFGILKQVDNGFIFVMIPIVIMYLVGIIRNKGIKIYSKNKFFLFLFIFTAICLLSNTWAMSKKLSMDASFSLLRIWIILQLLCCSMTSLKTERLPKIIMWGATLNILYIILTVGFYNIIIISQMGSRIENAEFNVNLVAMLGAMVVVICYSSILNNGFSWDIIAGLVGLMIVLTTGSRKAFIVLVIGLTMVYFFKKKIKNIFVFSVKFLCFCAIGFAFLYFLFSTQMFSTYAERFADLFAYFTDSGDITHSDWERSVLIEVGWNQFLEKPFTGIGIDNGRILAVPAVGHFFYLHNNFVELLADVGIFGFLSFYLRFILS